MKKLLIFLGCVTTFQLAIAQYGQRVYYAPGKVNESFNDGNYSTINLNGGLPTYVAAGISDSSGDIHSRFTRMATGGATVANRHYYVYGAGQPMNNYVNGIAESANRCIMAGAVFANPVFPLPGGSDVLVLRSNANGALASAAAIDINNGTDIASSAIHCTFQPNRFFIAGHTRQFNLHNAFVMKIMNTGVAVNWTRAYGLVCSSGVAGDTYATSIIEEPGTGNVFVVGYTSVVSATGSCQNAFISKFLNNGTHVFTEMYSDATTSGNGIQFESIKPMAGAPGNYVIAGNLVRPAATPPNGIFQHNPFLLTVNLAGATPALGLMQAYGLSTFAGAMDDAVATDVTSRINFNTGQREFFLSGYHTVNFMPNQGFIIKADLNGVLINTTSYGSAGSDALQAIDAVGNGAGPGDGLTAFGSYHLLTGLFQTPKCYWVKPYYNLVSGCNENNLLSFMFPMALTSQLMVPTFITNSTVVPLARAQVNDAQNTLCWSVNLSSGSNLKAGDLADAALLNLQVYPNPTTQAENLKVSLESSFDDFVTVSVYDTKGTLIYSVSEQINEGENQLQLSTQNLNTGLYLIRMQGKTIHAQKSFIVK